MIKAFNLVEDKNGMYLKESNITYGDILDWYKKQSTKLNIDKYIKDVQKMYIISYYYNSGKNTDKKYYIAYNVFTDKYVINTDSLSPHQPFFVDKHDAIEVLNNPNLRPIYDSAYQVGKPMECPFE